MSKPKLELVPGESEVYVLGTGPETRAQRVSRMQSNARALAREHIEAMVESLRVTAAIAEEIATGGDAYPIGVRELSGRLVRDFAAHAGSIEAILQRNGG